LGLKLGYYICHPLPWASNESSMMLLSGCLSIAERMLDFADLSKLLINNPQDANIKAHTASVIKIISFGEMSGSSFSIIYSVEGCYCYL